jgi:pimeloyl-ACP methyl ester carboxylesterase
MTTERFMVRSKDGVEISVLKAGSGPPLLLIHGALMNVTLSWDAVLPKLSEQFTVYAMDRRGRALSGDAMEYSIGNEVDDVVSVLDAIGAPVIVLGHSYGALLLLAALDRLKNVSRLILYEPPARSGEPRPDANMIMANMEQALLANDREEILTIFFRDWALMPPEGLRVMKASPMWPVALQVAFILPREMRVVNTYQASTERLSASKIPVILLLGTETQGFLRDAAFYLRDAMPDWRLLMLEGQGHGAMLDAPDFFADKILEIAN